MGGVCIHVGQELDVRNSPVVLISTDSPPHTLHTTFCIHVLNKVDHVTGLTSVTVIFTSYRYTCTLNSVILVDVLVYTTLDLVDNVSKLHDAPFAVNFMMLHMCHDDTTSPISLLLA